MVGAEAVEGAIRAAQLCRASEAADVPLKACRADQVFLGADEPAERADFLEADEARCSRGGRSIVRQRDLLSVSHAYFLLNVFGLEHLRVIAFACDRFFPSMGSLFSSQTLAPA